MDFPDLDREITIGSPKVNISYQPGKEETKIAEQARWKAQAEVIKPPPVPAYFDSSLKAEL